VKATVRRLPVSAAPVVALAQARIERALNRRARYKYVRPRVERLDADGRQGWKIVSPNCSRAIDPAGGDIDIAWLLQGPDGRWNLHVRHHPTGGWQPMAEGQTLDTALTRICTDPLKEFWP
jgi:hypothetical protein